MKVLQLNTLSEITALVLLAAAVVYRAPSFAYAASLVLAIIEASKASERLQKPKPDPLQVHPDIKKQLDNLEMRLTKFEYERSQRGF